MARFSYASGAVLLLLGGCAHERCTTAARLDVTRPLLEQAQRDGTAVCTADARYLGRWGRPAAEADVLLRVASGAVTLDRAGGRGRTFVRGACAGGTRGAPWPEDVAELVAAAVRGGAMTAELRAAGLDALTLDVARAASDAGLEVHVQPDAAVGEPCVELRDAWWQAHPLGATTSTTARPEGRTEKEEIRRRIRGDLVRFSQCYEQELAAHRELAGKVTLQFVIAPDGSVGPSEILVDTVHTAVSACVERVMGSLRFTRPKGGGLVLVTYPFVFASK